MGFCVSLLFLLEKKNVFKDLALLTLGKKISFKKFDSFFPRAIPVGLSIRGKCYLQHILQMKQTVPDASNGHNSEEYGKEGIFLLCFI